MSTDRDRDIDERLTGLEAASDQRRAELRAVLDQLPAAVSRRALVVSAAKDLRHAPNKSSIVCRALRKLGRAPGSAVRRLRTRLSS
jgi:ribosomal protein S12